MIRFSFLLKLENYLHVHDAADRSCLTFSIENNNYLTNSRKGNGELVMKPLQLMLNAKLHHLNKSSKIVKTFDLLYSSYNWEAYTNPLIFHQRLVMKENIYRYYRNSYSTTNTSYQ